MKTALIAYASRSRFAHIPSFLYCAVRAYPDAQIYVMTREELTPELLVECMNATSGFTNWAWRQMTEFWGVEESDTASRVLPWLIVPPEISEFDYACYLPIDLLLMPEKHSLVDQHLLDMERNHNHVFSNTMFVDSSAAYREMNAVHFVKVDNYFPRVAAVQATMLEQLKKDGFIPTARDNPEPATSQRALYLLLRDSDLGIPCEADDVFAPAHGIHLGRNKPGLNVTSDQIQEWGGIATDYFEDSAFVAAISSLPTEKIALLEDYAHQT